MRVLFLHPMPPASVLILQKITYHYGIGIISAVLKQHGHSVDYLALHKFSPAQIQRKIVSFKPDIIGISVTSNQFGLSAEIAGHIHERYRLPVVLGGVHPTVRPEESLSVPGVLGICIGEGEYPMLELVEALSAHSELDAERMNIPNFWFKHDGEIIKNPVRPLLENLDSLPFTDREIIDFQKLLNYHKYLEVRNSRGCPFHCSFCVNATYQELYRGKGKYYRTRSHDNILAEIEMLVGNYKNIKSIVFDDELMSVNKKWALEFFEKYRRKFDYPFNLTVRADLVEKEFVQGLKEAGCHLLMMGVESGDEYIRNDVLDKGVTTEKIIEAARVIKEAGIKLWTFNMVGVPYETPDSIEKTIALNKKLKPDVVFVSTFYPYPGTRLEKVCRDNGWISDRKIDGFFSNVTVLDQPSIKKSEVAYYHNIFPWAILYPRLLFIIKLLNRIKLGREKSVYDALFPVVKSVYEIYYRFKITLNL